MYRMCRKCFVSEYTSLFRNVVRIVVQRQTQTEGGECDNVIVGLSFYHRKSLVSGSVDTASNLTR